jgi:hypothetical protein
METQSKPQPPDKMIDQRMMMPLMMGEFGSTAFTFKMAKQIAEMFLETTVIVVDIAGFTAWASMREPYRVFTLLFWEPCTVPSTVKPRG